MQHYLQFHRESDRFKYRGQNKIPLETFHEMYFDGHVDVKGDMLEALEYRHDWASFRFTLSLFKFFLTGMVPEVVFHTRSQGKIRLSNFQELSADIGKMRNRSAATTIEEMTSTVGFSGHV